MEKFKIGELVEYAGLMVTTENKEKIFSLLENSPYKDMVKKGAFETITVECSKDELFKYVLSVCESERDIRRREEEERRRAEEEQRERERKALEEQREMRRRAQIERAKALAEIDSKVMVTTGFTFEGYRIVSYCGYVSGDHATSVDREHVCRESLIGYIGDKFYDSLSTIRENALIKMKEAAYNKGANGIIGVSFDYIPLDLESASVTGGKMYYPFVFCVTANGTAVKIEKE